MGRRYRKPVLFSGRSGTRTCAVGGHICPACAKSIDVGAAIQFDDKPTSRSMYHEACESVDVARETETEVHIEPAPAEHVKAARKPAPAGSIDAIIDARIDERLGAFQPDTAVDEEKVREIVAQATAREVVIKVQTPEGEERKIEGAHYLMPRLLKLLGAGLHVYLWGPAGSGKTTAALDAAKALALTGEIDTLDPTTPKSSILGYRTPNGDPVQTAFTRCYGDGAIYVADECDNAPAHVQTLFNSALANGHAPSAWGLIERSPRFGFVGTGNTPGRPTPQFPDRRPMSAAFADRLYFIHWPLDPAIECRAAGLPCPDAPERDESTCTIAQWVQWVQAVRAWAESNAPTLMVTPRASLLGKVALALGESPSEIADGLVFRGADKALVAKVLAANPLP